MDKDALIAQINAAFDGVSREGGVSLREAREISNEGTDEHRLLARLEEQDTCWQAVPESEIERFVSSAYQLDAIGLHYYLPAFMIYALHHFERDGQGISYTTVSFLELKQSKGKPDFEPYKLITYVQAQAIGGFLQYMAAHGDEYVRADAVRIFRDYWNYYP